MRIFRPALESRLQSRPPLKSLPRPGLESQARFQLKCPALPKKLCLETAAFDVGVVDDVVVTQSRFFRTILKLFSEAELEVVILRHFCFK